MTTQIASVLESKMRSARRLKAPARAGTGEQPRRFEREYIPQIRFFIETAHKVLEQLLIPRLPELQASAGITTNDGIRLDETWDETLDRILVVARGSFQELTGRQQVFTPEEMAAKVSPAQKEQTIKQFKQLTGVDIFIDDTNLANAINPFITENVGLIKTISSDYFDDIEGTVLRGFRSGQRANTIAAQIQKRTDVAMSRAKLIARDQMNKLWGDLARKRQTEAGIGTYTWRTVGDDRVRPTHRALNGKVFSWDNPPAVGHPGQPIQCRCWAEPRIDDVIDDLERRSNEVLGLPPPESAPVAQVPTAPVKKPVAKPKVELKPKAKVKPKAKPKVDPLKKAEAEVRKAEAAAKRLEKAAAKVAKAKAKLEALQKKSKVAAKKKPSRKKPSKKKPDPAFDKPDRYPKKGPIKRGMVLEDAEAAIKNQKVEHAVAFDADGNQLARAKGKKSAVGFTNKELDDVTAQPSGTVVMTHNHPSGGVLSGADMSLAVELDLAEMRAVAPNGTTFSFKRPKDGWGYSLDEIRNGAARDDFRNISDNAAARAVKKTRQRLGLGPGKDLTGIPADFDAERFKDDFDKEVQREVATIGRKRGKFKVRKNRPKT